VRMDIELYEWIREQGGAGWIRSTLEVIREHWSDKRSSYIVKQLGKLAPKNLPDS
jgi:hypothetical protein